LKKTYFCSKVSRLIAALRRGGKSGHHRVA